MEARRQAHATVPQSWIQRENWEFETHSIPVRRWRTAWRTACQAAGVPTRFLHDCRRTAARNLIRASVPERVATLLTGHKTRAIFDRYNIINEQEQLEAGDQLVAYLGSTHRRCPVAGGPTRPAPPLRAPRRPFASCDAPPRKRASGGAAGETGLDTRQPSGLADETRAPPGPPSAHGARPRRRRHIREPAPESRPHRHGWRQWPEPVAPAWDGARRRATRRSPPTARGVPDGGGQTPGATQRCLNPGFSERIGNSRRTGSCTPCSG